ncbi:MAG: tetratricopeptide repeat protein [Acidobacteria bacterium]|nr:tetratricopeptide repeat protein [Acidobacteriota bacterium]
MTTAKGSFIFATGRTVRTLQFSAILVMMLLLAAHAGAQGEPDQAADGVALFQKAQDLHEKGDLKAAIELYEKAIAAMGEFPEAEYQRGHALLALGRDADAEKAFRRAVETRPDWTLALANLGSILVGKGAYAEAEKLLLKAVSLDDQNTLAYSALVELRLRSKAPPEELKKLLAHLTLLTSGVRSTSAAWAARAALERELGQKPAAKASLENALALDPKNRFALMSKANAAMDEGDIRGAEPLVRSLEAISPAAASTKALRARILYANGKPDEAIEMLDMIADPTPEVAELRDRMLLSSTENPADLEKQLAKKPADPFILGKLCRLYRLKDPAKALDLCRRASEAEPSNLGHAIGFAAALVQAKRYTDAVDLLRRLEAISPDNVTIRANLATALFQLKRYAEAKTEYRWLIEKQPATSIAYYFLGISHDQLTEYADAMANYQLFLRYADPDKNKLEIEKVNLRLPVLQRQIKEKKGKGN